MSHQYTPHRTDTFGFAVFFIGAVVALAVANHKISEKSPKLVHLFTVCTLLVVSILPATIYLRLTLSEHREGLRRWVEAWKVWRGEAVANSAIFAVFLILWIPNHYWEETRRGETASLHWTVNQRYYDEASRLFSQEDDSANEGEHDPTNTTQDDPNSRQADLTNIREDDLTYQRHNEGKTAKKGDANAPNFLRHQRQHHKWWFAFVSLLVRYVLLYILVLPFNIGCNLFVVDNLYTVHHIPPVVTFEDSLFFIIFGGILVAAALYIGICVDWFQGVVHFLLLFHVALIGYFISNSFSLTSLLFATMTILLSTTYSLITDKSVNKSYNHPCLLRAQLRSWQERESTSFRPYEQYYLKHTLPPPLSPH